MSFMASGIKANLPGQVFAVIIPSKCTIGFKLCSCGFVLDQFGKETTHFNLVKDKQS